MGATAVYHLGRAFGFDRGFAEFSDVTDAGRSIELTADEVNRAVFSMLERFSARDSRLPFFLFVHYFDPHSPYLLRQAGRVTEASGSLGRLVAGYDSEIRFVDEHVGYLMKRLQSLGLTEKLLICVTADHGEEFGERGNAGGHADMYRETHRVPLIVTGPGVPRARISTRVSSVDLPVTLAGLAGAAYSSEVDGVPFSWALHSPTSSDRQQDRPFLLLGYPSYTRSAQILQGSWSFIWNLDGVYERAYVQRLSDVDTDALVEDGFREVLPAPTPSGGAAVYPLPIIDLEPHWMTTVIRGKPQGCPARVSVRLDPGMTYFEDPIELGRGLRLRFPVSRYDHAAIEVIPAECGDAVFALWTEYSTVAPHVGSGMGIVTAIHRGLMTRRKTTKHDELFDLSTDPGMLNNLAEEASQELRANEMKATLKAAYRLKAEPVAADPLWQYSEEDWERLKALGYVQ
jgi:hypothetical protein